MSECEWCRKEITGDGFSDDGFEFCDEVCAQDFDTEWNGE